MTLHRFHLPPDRISGAIARLTSDDTHQIRRVLRLTSGHEIELFDGSGRALCAILKEMGSREGTAEIVAESWPEVERPAPLILVQSLIKGDRLDGIIEKATELGVAGIVLFPAARSVRRMREDRSSPQVDRWRRIAEEAAEQSGRVNVPVVDLLPTLSIALDRIGAPQAGSRPGASPSIEPGQADPLAGSGPAPSSPLPGSAPALWMADETLAGDPRWTADLSRSEMRDDRNRSPAASRQDELMLDSRLRGNDGYARGRSRIQTGREEAPRPDSPEEPTVDFNEDPSRGSIVVLIGPEGGWTPEERSYALERGARRMSLGPRILRADTAALVALARFS